MSVCRILQTYCCVPESQRRVLSLESPPPLRRLRAFRLYRRHRLRRNVLSVTMLEAFWTVYNKTYLSTDICLQKPVNDIGNSKM